MSETTQLPEQMLGARRCVLLMVAACVLCVTHVFAQQADTQEAPLVIGVALNLPPYSFLDENGRAAGYSVDLTRAIARVMRFDVEVRMGPWGEIRQALENGEIDAAPMFYSVERDKLVDFSSPFTIVHNAILMRRDTPTIETEDDLRGKDIIVIRGDIMHDYVLENGLSDNPVLVPTESDALRLLASGEHDCALMAQLPGLYWAKELELSNIVTAGPLLCPSRICYAMAEGNTALRHLLSEGMATLEKTGEHKRIHDKWLGVLAPRGVSLSTVLKYIALAVVPLLLLLVLFVTWSHTLKRQVAQRTRELSASEDRFRTICENAPALINAFDENGRCVLWNKQCRETFGWTIDEINEYDDALALFYPDPATRDAVMRRVTIDPDRRFRECHPVTKDGKTLTTMWANFRLPDDTTFSLGYDITARKQAVKELRKSELLLAETGRMAKVGGWEIDVNTLDVNWTDETYRIHEVPLGHKVPLDDVIRFFHPEDRPKLETAIQKAIDHGEPCDMKIRFITAKGNHLWTHVVCKPITVDGKTVRLSGVFQDITDRKRAELELEKHRKHLEDMVRERTTQLDARVAEAEELNSAMVNVMEDLRVSNVELKAIGRELMVSNKELDTFSYSVSHDLRAPLRHIDGFVKLLLKREKERLDPTSSRYLETIAESSNRMGQLIDDLLAFSRTGRTAMQLQRVDLNEVIREVRKGLFSLLEGRRVTWEVGDLPAVEADHGLLQLVWENLIGNAIKYTGPCEEARIEIGATCAGIAEGAGKVAFFVRDNGVGFDPQYIHKLFDVFQRLHRKDEFEGTGIGLATVRRIVQRHGGRVWAEGEVGHGATFYFTLQEAREDE